MNLAEKMEGQMNAAVLSGILNNVKNFIPEQHRADFEKGMNEFLPKIKEFVIGKLDELNKQCGEKDEDKKFFLLHNMTGSPEIWVYPKKTMTSLEGEVESEYPLEKLVAKINAYEKTEALIADLLTLKLFDLTEKK